MLVSPVIRGTVSRMPVFLWIVGALSLVTGSLPFEDVPRQLGFVSPGPHGCRLKFSDLGTNATCTSLDLRYVPQDLPMNTIMLDLSYNKITTLYNESFVYLIDIISLWVIENRLRRLEEGVFQPLIHLKELSLLRNRLVSLPSGLFSSNHRLSKLILAGNQFGLIPSSSLPLLNNMTFLDLVSNKISTISPHDFSPLENCSLTRLSLRANALHDLPSRVFSYLRKIDTLSLNKNVFSELHISSLLGNTNIQRLYLKSCKINGIVPLNRSSVTLDGLPTIINLSLVGNRINSIVDFTFWGLNRTNVLELQANRIALISNKPFCGLDQLIELDLSHNKLASLSSGIFSCNKMLQRIKLAGNNIASFSTDILSGLPFLTHLSLSQNSIGDVYCGINILAVTCAPFAVVLLAVICFMAYWNRWWFNYKIFLLKLAICGYEEINHDFDAQEYEYQLNLMYIEDDEGWVDEIMKPVLQERFPHLQKVVWGDNNLNISMFYINALHYATDNSFKTVLLLSYNSVDDAWFLTKLRIALEHLNDTRLDKVILIFLEDIKDDDLPYLVRLFLSKNKPYMLWTEDEDGQKLFWAQFEKSMRTNRAFNNVIPI
ncbi:insulin-like growth factor-binding protein complex acid labile subunit [Strongylocentrotus purpuratus]|uniref:TIR domain-containing protein n=1 Tax=Strongylocentrotus purpuratus TaxID=7668 RepID=A0A7M7PH19_STRPU|nr:insulin-like growth factor-binding protein complex acid labile subunit [Strongylocentrotus purpuratus]